MLVCYWDVMGYSDSDSEGNDSETDDEELAYNHRRGKSSGLPLHCHMINGSMSSRNTCKCYLYFSVSLIILYDWMLWFSLSAFFLISFTISLAERSYWYELVVAGIACAYVQWTTDENKYNIDLKVEYRQI